MRKTAMGALALCLFAGVLPLVAQDDGARPAPNVLQIFREVVKPGRNAAHEKSEAAWPKAFRGNKNSPHYIGMVSITGPSEAWFLSGYPSYEAWEQQFKAEEGDAALSAEEGKLMASDGELLDSVRSITAHFRADLSMRPPLNIGTYRYINVITVRVRPGTQDKFIEMRKIIKAAHEKAGLKDYYSVFEVQSGMPAPTYLIMIPMKSLKEADEAMVIHDTDAYKEALGGEEGQKKLRELASGSVNSNESMIFAFNPKMSVPTPEQVSGAPAFWNPKPAMAPKAKAAPAEAKKP